MVRALKTLIILVILLIPACGGLDQSTTPEGIYYLTLLTKIPPELVNGEEKPGCWLEFMLVNRSGRPVASEGKVTVTISSKASHNKKYQKEFNIKETDFREKPLANIPGIKGKPICGLVGPLPEQLGPGIVITFQFQRPDGLIFRRQITPSS